MQWAACGFERALMDFGPIRRVPIHLCRFIPLSLWLSASGLQSTDGRVDLLKAFGWQLAELLYDVAAAVQRLRHAATCGAIPRRSGFGGRHLTEKWRQWAAKARVPEYLGVTMLVTCDAFV